MLVVSGGVGIELEAPLKGSVLAVKYDRHPASESIGNLESSSCFKYRVLTGSTGTIN